MNIPDSMPTLSADSHLPGSGKACVMEYVSLLAGEEWSDTPRCTHPLLAEAAQSVNDGLSDDERHALVPLIGRLFGTTVDVDLRPWLRAFQNIGRVKPGRSAGWECHNEIGARILAAWCASDSIDSVAFLVSMIDEYDRLSGRTEHRALSDDDLASLAHRVSA